MSDAPSPGLSALLTCPDVPVSPAFYRDRLGFEVAAARGRGVELPEPSSRVRGLRSVGVDDPAGYRLSFYTPAG